MLKRLCSYPGCNLFAVAGHTYCEKHLAQSKKRHEEWLKEHKPFATATRANESLYHTYKWISLRKKILKENDSCRICGKTDGLTVDHIIPPRGNEELFFNENNLQVLCVECHRIKTQQETQERKYNEE